MDRTADAWNGVRHREGTRGVESWFLKLGDHEGRRALWIKATILDRGPEHGGAVAEAWAVAFDREAGHAAAKQTVPLADAHFAPDRLDVRVADLAIEAGHVRGSVADGTTRIAFDLRFDLGAGPLVPLPFAAMYDARLPRSKFVTPYPDSLFRGHYEVDGARVEVSAWRGMQGHNWGDAHTEHYAWAHCSQWDGDPQFVLEGISAQVKVAGVVLPPMTPLVVIADGVRYAFTAPVTIARARGDIGLRNWVFATAQGDARVDGELWAAAEDFVGLAYENPDGVITHCLNSKIAHGRVRFEVDGRETRILTTRCAALELGTKDPHHGIRMRA